MKVLALGGAGGMGRFAVRTAMDIPEVESIVVADLSAEAAQGFAETLPGTAKGIALDVTDSSALREAMLAADVVLNTTGPFFKFGVLILTAAIEAGCHYLDICDDWEPTLEMLGLDTQAREAGVTAIVGLGASPGLSNLLGRAAMQELDTVQEVYTGWDLSVAIPEEESAQTGVNAATEHAVQQITGTVKVWRDGNFAMVRPLTRVAVDYPGIGSREVHIFGHPEAVTFPHHYPEIRTSLNVADGIDGQEWIFLTLRWLVDHRWVSLPRAARFMEWMERSLPTPEQSDFLEPDRLPPLYGLAVGTKDGRPASAAVAMTHIGEVGMGFATGVPLACGLELLAKGELAQPGVGAPEGGAIDPQRFFEILGTKGSQPLSGDKPSLLVSRSWDPDVRENLERALSDARAQISAVD